MSALILAVSGAPSREAGGLPLRRLVGPGLLVAVGYVDPGNWATDIAGGSAFGYQLLGVVILASLIAMVFQTLVARVVLATGEDLATLSARHMPRPVAKAAWLAGEAAILATAFAELVGGAIALQLLFGLALPVGIVVTGVATAAFLALSGLRKGAHEQVVNILIGVVALAFIVLLVQIGPDWGAAAQGVADTGKALSERAGLVLALGILGATLMPHNLYLHSGMLAERMRDIRNADKAIAYRIARNDTVVSLGLAMFVNAAIMIVAAASLSASGVQVSSVEGAHDAMRDVLGVGAAILFAIALYAAGQSSAITGVMAGRVISRGFAQGGAARSRFERWRGVVTRIVVALAALGIMAISGKTDADSLLVGSQVVLGIALPFALVPLVIIASRRSIMGDRVISMRARIAMGGITAAIIALNVGSILA
ncbi:Nramp family divalent metal transporter [Viridibacterium curvum]|uniref:Nramp family divalent metal transporter n=1 Tax=Viridibacterium curvum TaxID=1101404 RepID=A0ABP9QSH6_9RHOO